MAQFREWIHTVHSALDASKPLNSYDRHYSNPASWTSDEDTESESEQSFRSFECRRKKPCAMMCVKTRAFEPAAPVMIPSRTHDFGWCDRDDLRAQQVTCPCGNDCDEFFHDERSVRRGRPPKAQVRVKSSATISFSTWKCERSAPSLLSVEWRRESCL